MPEREIEYSPARGEAAFSAFADMEFDPPDTRFQMNGLDFRDGLMSAMIRAELLAAQAGVVPLVQLPDGQSGVLEVGRARRIISKPELWAEKPKGDPKDVEIVYLAVHAACRQASGFARSPSKGTPVIRPETVIRAGTPSAAVFDSATFKLSPPPPREFVVLSSDLVFAPAIVLPPLAIVLIVLGLAAVIGYAWYATSTRNVETEADRVVNVAASGELATLGAQQLSKTGKIQPEIVEALRDLGNREKQGSIWMPVSIGLIGLGLGVAAVVGVTMGAKEEKRAA